MHIRFLPLPTLLQKFPGKEPKLFPDWVESLMKPKDPSLDDTVGGWGALPDPSFCTEALGEPGMSLAAASQLRPSLRSALGCLPEGAALPTAMPRLLQGHLHPRTSP